MISNEDGIPERSNYDFEHSWSWPSSVCDVGKKSSIFFISDQLYLYVNVYTRDFIYIRSDIYRIKSLRHSVFSSPCRQTCSASVSDIMRRQVQTVYAGIQMPTRTRSTLSVRYLHTRHGARSAEIICDTWTIAVYPPDENQNVKPLLHFHGFGPGLLRFGTVVTPANFGPGSTLSTVLLRCSYGTRGRSTEDLRVRPGYAKE